MKVFLAMVVCLMFLAPVANAEASHQKYLFQIEADVFELVEPFSSETVIFRNISTGTELYEMLVVELNRLTKSSKRNHYPLIVLPITALPEDLWLELEAEVRNRRGLLMELVCYDGAGTGETFRMIKAFAFSLPQE